MPETISHRIASHGFTRNLFLLALAISFLPAARSQAQSLASRNGAVSAAAAQSQAAAQAAGAGQAGLSPEAAAGLQRQLSLQARNALAIEAIRAAQVQARAAAVAGTNFLRDSRGNPLNAVPNGLGVGGLDPAVVQDQINAGKASVATAADQRQIWQGGLLPTEKRNADGSVNVTVKQTDAQAIFSWKTFNVGKETELLFDQGGNKGWVALNRVVSGLDSTGRRDGNGGPAPSQILGRIKADGTVLILNQNGILFGGSSQVNVNTLIASTAEIAPDRLAASATVANSSPFILSADATTLVASTLADRNDDFLARGLNPTFTVYGRRPVGSTSPLDLLPDLTPPSSGIRVDAGAQLTADTGGSIILNSSAIENNGIIAAKQGNVALIAGLGMTLRSYTGVESGPTGNINIRGLGAAPTPFLAQTLGYAANEKAAQAQAQLAAYQALGNTAVNRGLISTPEGSIVIGDNLAGGILSATTSISRNGYIEALRTLENSVVSILPELNRDTTPQDPQLILNIKSSTIVLGDVVGRDALVYVPGGNVSFRGSSSPNLIIDTGAIVSVAGLKNVKLDASRNELKVFLKGNELADSGGYQDSFLNGATVYLDPRVTGVRSDGLSWIGSPLINAKAIAEQVPVGIEEVLTRAGSVIVAGGTTGSLATIKEVVLKQGALVDISGGWVTYAPGTVRTTQLLTTDGRVIDISKADPTRERLEGFAGDFIVNHKRWGVTERFSSVLGGGAGGIATRFSDGYIEGRDAGKLTFPGAINVLDGKVDGSAYSGSRQINDSIVGTGAPRLPNQSAGLDQRSTQGAASQLPAGGYLRIGGPVTSQSEGSIAIVRGDSIVPAEERSGYAAARGYKTVLSDTLLSNSGLSQVSLAADGPITIDKNASVTLNPGGVFDARSGRTFTVDGAITVAGGKILLSTQQNPRGRNVTPSLFNTAPVGPGSFDLVVNGVLSVRGLWVNNYLKSNGDLEAFAFLNGGTISLSAASSTISNQFDTLLVVQSGTKQIDVSGSILVNDGALLDLTGGGSVSATGKVNSGATGGSLTLSGATQYYVDRAFTDTSSFIPTLAAIRQKVLLARGATVLSAGFGGGGTFTLTTPQFTFGDNPVTDLGTVLPFDFINRQGFQNYSITSNKTAFAGVNTQFTYQKVTIGAGQTLSLRNRVLPSLLGADDQLALRSLKSGGDVLSLLGTTDVPDIGGASYGVYRKPVNLALDGLLALDIQKGGSVTGEPGATLSVPKLINEGVIRLPGGTIAQREISPDKYLIGDLAPSAARLGIAQAKLLESGIYLAPGSVTDLSGTSLTDPFASALINGVPTAIRTGRLVNGGRISIATPEYRFTTINPNFYLVRNHSLVATPGSLLDISGAADVFDRQQAAAGGFVKTPVWSDGGSISAPSGFTLTGATIRASGGNRLARGGTLEVGGSEPLISRSDPVTLVATDGATPVSNAISATTLTASGFDNLIVRGNLTSSGDVSLCLRGSIFILPKIGTEYAAPRVDNVYSVIDSGGKLDLRASYIHLEGFSDTPGLPGLTQKGRNSLSLSADAIDIVRAVVFGDNAGSVKLSANGDIRLIGDRDPPYTFKGSTGFTPRDALVTTGPLSEPQGSILASGDLTLEAERVYPATGTAFSILSRYASGTIDFERRGSPRGSPYSAGASLFVQAASIVQNGALFAPQGSITLGSLAPVLNFAGNATVIPVTSTLTFGPNSLTSVSGAGISIPYGTTSDQKEYFFAPNNQDALKAPPAKSLTLAAATIAVQPGATIDLSGGGDLYAYEYVPGRSSSRDILNGVNTDRFTNNPGNRLYNDGRQVFAIVPDSLSLAAVAAYDPLYSANYASLLAPGTSSDLSSRPVVGTRVFLNGGNGVPAGWYTLLPAQYATLPGSYRVVQSAASAIDGSQPGVAADGTVSVTGYFGGLGGTRESTLRRFDVQSRSVIDRYTKLSLTSANTYFSGSIGRDQPFFPVSQTTPVPSL